MTLHSEEAMKSTMAAYYSTSGTTGLPKLVMFSHHALVAQQVALQGEGKVDRRPGTPYPTVRLACLPLFHVFGAAWLLFATIRHGQPVYVMERFHLDRFVKNVDRFGVTETYVTPPIIHMLMNTIKSGDTVKESLPVGGEATGSSVRAKLDTLRYVGTGGAPIDAVSLGNFRSRLLNPHHATVTQVWGMSEFGVATLFRQGDQDETGAIGRLLPGYEMTLVDTEGRRITDKNESGELLVRSPGLMVGYKKLSDEAGAAAGAAAGAVVTETAKDSKGWLRTGDIVRTKDGKLYITGRAKELIKAKGYAFPLFPPV